MITREIGWNAGLPDWLMIAMDLAIFAVVVTVITIQIRQRRSLWKVGKDENRTDRIGDRIKSMLFQGLMQRSLLKDRYPGLLHAMLFFGFVVLFIGTSIIVIQEYITKPIFQWKFLEEGE